MSVSERREREREQRRNLILDAAERIFYAAGLEGATMESVAADAQVGKGTLYLYFQSKEDLLMGLVTRRQHKLQDCFERARREIAGDGLALIRRYLLAYAEQMMTPPEHLQLAMSCWAGAKLNGADPDRSQVVMSLFEESCQAVIRGQKNGSIRSDIAATELTTQLWSCVNGLLVLQLQRRRFSDSVITRHVPPLERSIELLLDGVRSPDGARQAGVAEQSPLSEEGSEVCR